MVPTCPVHLCPAARKLIPAFLAALLLSGCQKSPATESKAAGTYTVATTVGMVSDIVRQVAGDKAVVAGIIGEGVDPHLYKPTRNDIAALQSADVIFYSGLLLEGRMTDILEKAASGGKPVFAVTSLLDESYLLTAPGAQGHHDPHVWMDVAAWSKAVEAVSISLATYDPPNTAYYAANADRYRAELAELDAYAKTALASIPESKRVLVTAHDAFNYFGRAYGLEVLGIQGISTESEAGLEDINSLVRRIVDRDIAAVFVETSVADKNIRALIEGAAARGKSVRIGGSLFSDAMGRAGAYEGTYIGMIDHNVTVIAEALGGQVPARGFKGRLAESGS